MVQQSLRYFVEVARTGSIRQASEIFYVAPSAISRQILNLEKEFGAELFDRSPRGMALTEAGRLLVSHVLESERRLREVKDAIDGLGELQRGIVKIALVEAVSFSFLPQLIVDFIKHYPNIDFNLRVCGTAEIVELVADHSADFGLSFNTLNRDDVKLHGRIAQPLHLICHPGHPLAARGTVSMADAEIYKVAVPDRSFGIRYLIEKAASESNVVLDIAFEANSLQTIKNIVSKTEVIGFMPWLTFESEFHSKTLACVKLDNAAFTTATIDLISSKNRKMSVAAATFMSSVLSQLRAYV